MRFANLSVLSVAAAAVAAMSPAMAGAQAPSVVGHSVDVARERASLELQLSDNNVVKVSLAHGALLVNGHPSGSYADGGPLDQAWRAFLDSAAGWSTSAVVTATRKWKLAGMTGPELDAGRSMVSAMTSLQGVPVEAVEIEPPLPPGAPSRFRVQVDEQPVVIQDGGVPQSSFAGVGPLLAGLVGSFVALACIAFGLVSFAPRNLDVVSDTVQNSFGRSFLAGLFAQPLLLPALATIIIGLVLTIVGILAIPFAIIGFVLAVALAVVGGYIAAARAIGEIYLRRKMARGIMVSADPTFRAVVVGLGGLLLIWAPFALLGWIPGFGTVLFGAASIFTWVMATAGLGATILSRAGLRSAYGRQVTPQMSGELSWSTVDEIAPSHRAGEGSPR